MALAQTGLLQLNVLQSYVADAHTQEISTMYTWKLAGFEPGDGIAHGAHLQSYDDAAWLPVTVPGDVHRTGDNIVQ
jgi:hypothetical protein